MDHEPRHCRERGTVATNCTEVISRRHKWEVLNNSPTVRHSKHDSASHKRQIRQTRGLYSDRNHLYMLDPFQSYSTITRPRPLAAARTLFNRPSIICIPASTSSSYSCCPTINTPVDSLCIAFASYAQGLWYTPASMALRYEEGLLVKRRASSARSTCVMGRTPAA